MVKKERKIGDGFITFFDIYNQPIKIILEAFGSGSNIILGSRQVEMLLLDDVRK